MPSVFRKKFLKKIDNDFFKNLKKAIEKKRTSIGGRKHRFCPNKVRTKSLGGEISTPLDFAFCKIINRCRSPNFSIPQISMNC